MKWEYKFYRCVGDCTTDATAYLLNTLGADGWEMVTVVVPTQFNTLFVFKRRIGQEET